ncbi:hypothetical protein CGRA01v4_08767 [Colletotrichum graminicola]|nr:hypothetical protein CGRA01v4_08767 [Colletotrichum graminicola]
MYLSRYSRHQSSREALGSSPLPRTPTLSRRSRWNRLMTDTQCPIPPQSRYR